MPSSIYNKLRHNTEYIYICVCIFTINEFAIKNQKSSQLNQISSPKKHKIVCLELYTLDGCGQVFSHN
jgi:hypothetical protein